VFIEAKDDGWGGDNWTYKSCKAPVKSSTPTNQHPVFLQAGCHSCRPANSVKALKGKISHFMDLLTLNSPGSLPTLSLTTNSSWLPWGRVAMPLFSPLMPIPLCCNYYYYLLLLGHSLLLVPGSGTLCLKTLHLRRLDWCFNENRRRICFGNIIQTSYSSLFDLLRPLVLVFIT